jgi:hypothetical protein
LILQLAVSETPDRSPVLTADQFSSSAEANSILSGCIFNDFPYGVLKNLVVFLQFSSVFLPWIINAFSSNSFGKYSSAYSPFSGIEYIIFPVSGLYGYK